MTEAHAQREAVAGVLGRWRNRFLAAAFLAALELLEELSERRLTVTEHGHCRESLSDCWDYCQTTVGLSGSVGLLSEVTVGLSDRGSGV